VNSETLFPHLAVNRYGRFVLPDAIRPGAGVPIRPRQGYRTGIYRDRAAGLKLPMLSAAVSAEHLFDAFLALIEPLGEEVTAVLESSHGRDADDYREFRRDRIDTPVLASHFCDFEKLLTHDGCTGVAVLNASVPMEVQFDEHKLLHVYAPDLTPFRDALKALGVRRRKELALICEAEHLHHTTDDYENEFDRMCLRVGVGDFESVFSDEGEGESEVW